MSNAYPISAPVEFVNTTAGDLLDFNAVVGAGANIIRDFVTLSQGDIIVSGESNNLSRLPVGSSGQTLTVGSVQEISRIVITDTLATALADPMYFNIGSSTGLHSVTFGTAAGTTGAGGTEIYVDSAGNIANTAAAVANAIVTAVNNFNSGATFRAESISIDQGDGEYVVYIRDLAGGAAVGGSASDGTPAENTGFGISTEQTGSATLTPIWQTPAGSAGGTMTAEISTVAAIAAADTWTTLDNGNVTYAAGTYGSVTGLNTTSGIYVPPADGVYDISARVEFQANNKGGAVTLTNAPTGRATRQLAVRIASGAAPAEDNTSPTFYSARQAEASNSNATFVQIVNMKLALTTANQVALQVRHDSNTDLNIESGMFSIHRVS